MEYVTEMYALISITIYVQCVLLIAVVCKTAHVLLNLVAGNFAVMVIMLSYLKERFSKWGPVTPGGSTTHSQGVQEIICYKL